MTFSLALTKQIGDEFFAYFWEPRTWTSEEEVSSIHKSLPLGTLSRDGMVESWVVYDRSIEALGLPASTPTGIWAGFKVSQDTFDALTANTPGTYRINKALTVEIDSPTPITKATMPTTNDDFIQQYDRARAQGASGAELDALYRQWQQAMKSPPREVAKSTPAPSDPTIGELVGRAFDAAIAKAQLNSRNWNKTDAALLKEYGASEEAKVLYSLHRHYGDYRLSEMDGIRKSANGVSEAITLLKSLV